MADAPVGRLLLTSGMQTGISLLVYSLLGVTDVLIVSWGVGAAAAGAISAASPVTLVLSAVNTIAGTGGGAAVSAALGKKDYEKAAVTAANVFMMFWAIAAVFTAVGLIFLDSILIGIGAGGELLPYAREYSVIIIAGSVTSTGFSSLIRAEGANGYALLQWIIPISVNMALDPVLVFVCDAGVTGAALGTLAAQILSVCMGMGYFFLSPRRPYRICARHFRPDAAVLKNVVLTGLPSFLQMIGIAVIQAVSDSFLIRYGETAVTAFGFVSRIRQFFILPQYGLFQAAQPIISYNHASGADDRARKAVRYAIISSLLAGAVCTLPAILLRVPLLRLFTADDSVINTGSRMIPFMTGALALQGGVMLACVCYQSVGNRKLASAVTFAAFAAVQLPSVLIGGTSAGMTGICVSCPVSDVLSYVMAMLFLAKRPVIRKKEVYS